VLQDIDVVQLASVDPPLSEAGQRDEVSEALPVAEQQRASTLSGYIERGRLTAITESDLVIADRSLRPRSVNAIAKTSSR
jgi:hypothetical protein